MTVTTKSRPIIMSADSVRAILDGRKTQTRRVVKHAIELCPNPGCGNDGIYVVADEDGDPMPAQCEFCYTYPDSIFNALGHCPYGVPGDLLWVRETFCSCRSSSIQCLPRDATYVCLMDGQQVFKGDVIGCKGRVLGEGGDWPPHRHPEAWEHMKFRSPRYMPRWATRLSLRVVKVRVERVQEISEADAMAEGVWAEGVPSGRHTNEGDAEEVGSYRAGFAALWDSLNEKRGHPWSNNDWVWVIGFERTTQETT